MAIDTSIYSQVGKPAIPLADPAEMMQRFQTLQAGVNQNKLFQSQQAAGQAAQAAIDPSTGQLDTNKLNMLLSQNPAAAPAALATLGQSQNLASGQTGLQTQRRNTMIQHLYGLSILPDDQLQGGAPVFNLLDQEKAAGIIDQNTYDQARKNFPQPGASAQEFRQALNSGLVSTLGGPEALQTALGKNDTMQNGQVLQPGLRSGVLNPNGAGQFQPSGQATKQLLSPGEMTAQHTIINPDGSTGVESGAQRAARQGQGDLTGASARPSVFPPGYNGQYAPRQTADAQGMTPVLPSSAPPAPGGIVQTGLPSGQVEEANASVQHLTAARDAANTFQNRIQPLLQAQAALAANPTTGVGSDTLNQIRQRIGTFTPGFLDGIRPLGGSAEQDAAYDEARKYLTNYAANTPGSARSDAGLATAEHANASTTISPLAARQVIQAAIGMERMKQAQLMEFNSKNLPASAYDRFASQTATNADPRAFMADQQTPAQRAAIIASLGPAAPEGGPAGPRERYLGSIRLALKHGLMQMPTSPVSQAAASPSPIPSMSAPMMAAPDQPNGRD